MVQDSLFLRSWASLKWLLVATGTREVQDHSTGSSWQLLPTEIPQTRAALLCEASGWGCPSNQSECSPLPPLIWPGATCPIHSNVFSYIFFSHDHSANGDSWSESRFIFSNSFNHFFFVILEHAVSSLFEYCTQRSFPKSIRTFPTTLPRLCTSPIRSALLEIGPSYSYKSKLILNSMFRDLSPTAYQLLSWVLFSLVLKISFQFSYFHHEQGTAALEASGSGKMWRTELTVCFHPQFEWEVPVASQAVWKVVEVFCLCIFNWKSHTALFPRSELPPRICRWEAGDSVCPKDMKKIPGGHLPWCPHGAVTWLSAMQGLCCAREQCRKPCPEGQLAINVFFGRPNKNKKL